VRHIRPTILSRECTRPQAAMRAEASSCSCCSRLSFLQVSCNHDSWSLGACQMHASFVGMWVTRDSRSIPPRLAVMRPRLRWLRDNLGLGCPRVIPCRVNFLLGVDRESKGWHEHRCQQRGLQ
jgi:hypothetical protein